MSDANTNGEEVYGLVTPNGIITPALQGVEQMLRPEGGKVTQATVLADLMGLVQATLARGGWDGDGEWGCDKETWMEFCDKLEDIMVVADSFWDDQARFNPRLVLPTPAGNQGGGG